MNTLKTMMLLAALTALFMGVGYLIGGAAGMAIAFVFALGTNLFAFWNSDKVVLRMHGAKQATARSEPELLRTVERLAQNAGLPMPGVYVMSSDQPNAFATGRNPGNAAVAVTTGIMRTLSRDELAGVIAHELGHIRNRDTLIMTMAATIGGAISMLAQFARFLSRGRGRGGFGFIGVFLAALFAPIAALLIQMLISRTREYSADRAGAEISGHPLSLASALGKISGDHRHVMPSAERNPASAHMFIVNPLSGAGMDNLFSTHPKVENRIAALRKIAAGNAPITPPGRSVQHRKSSIPTVRRSKRGFWR